MLLTKEWLRKMRNLLFSKENFNEFISFMLIHPIFSLFCCWGDFAISSLDRTELFCMEIKTFPEDTRFLGGFMKKSIQGRFFSSCLNALQPSASSPAMTVEHSFSYYMRQNLLSEVLECAVGPDI